MLDNGAEGGLVSVSCGWALVLWALTPIRDPLAALETKLMLAEEVFPPLYVVRVECRKSSIDATQSAL